MNQNDYIAHWGIRGMKWGIRRYQNADGTLTEAGKKRRASKEEKKTKVSKMSDSELQQSLSRLRMEAEYKRLLAERKPKRSGRIKKIMGDIGEQAVKSLATKGIEKIVKKVFSEPDPRTKLDVKDVTKLSDKKLAEYNKRYAAEKLARKNAEERISEIAERAERNRIDSAERARYEQWLEDRAIFNRTI